MLTSWFSLPAAALSLFLTVSEFFLHENLSLVPTSISYLNVSLCVSVKIYIYVLK